MSTPGIQRFCRIERAPLCAKLGDCTIEFLGRAHEHDGQITEAELAVQIRQGACILVTATLRQDAVDRPPVSRVVCSPVIKPDQARTLARALDIVGSIAAAWESLVECASFEVLFRALQAEAAARIPSAGTEVDYLGPGQHQAPSRHA